MKNRIYVFALIFLLGISTIVESANKVISAQGMVIGLQGTEDSPKFEEPRSISTAVEIWIARIDHWSGEYKNRTDKETILIKYCYSRQDEHVALEELNRTVWKFELQELSDKEKKSCMAWVAPDHPFTPTSLAGGKNLPSPGALPCFLMTKRPVPASPTPTTR
jgi:hypothetical protein